MIATQFLGQPTDTFFQTNITSPFLRGVFSSACTYIEKMQRGVFLDLCLGFCCGCVCFLRGQGS